VRFVRALIELAPRLFRILFSRQDSEIQPIPLDLDLLTLFSPERSEDRKRCERYSEATGSDSREYPELRVSESREFHERPASSRAIFESNRDTLMNYQWQTERHLSRVLSFPRRVRRRAQEVRKKRRYSTFNDRSRPFVRDFKGYNYVHLCHARISPGFVHSRELSSIRSRRDSSIRLVAFYLPSLPPASAPLFIDARGEG